MVIRNDQLVNNERRTVRNRGSTYFDELNRIELAEAKRFQIKFLVISIYCSAFLLLRSYFLLLRFSRVSLRAHFDGRVSGQLGVAPIDRFLQPVEVIAPNHHLAV